ncbi:MAG: hypothetical protein ACFE0O_04315 [Opitutales bacterium]
MEADFLSLAEDLGMPPEILSRRLGDILPARSEVDASLISRMISLCECIDDFQLKRDGGYEFDLDYESAYYDRIEVLGPPIYFEISDTDAFELPEEDEVLAGFSNPPAMMLLGGLIVPEWFRGFVADTRFAYEQALAEDPNRALEPFFDHEALLPFVDRLPDSLLQSLSCLRPSSILAWDDLQLMVSRRVYRVCQWLHFGEQRFAVLLALTWAPRLWATLARSPQLVMEIADTLVTQFGLDYRHWPQRLTDGEAGVQSYFFLNQVSAKPLNVRIASSSTIPLSRSLKLTQLLRSPEAIAVLRYLKPPYPEALLRLLLLCPFYHHNIYREVQNQLNEGDGAYTDDLIHATRRLFDQPDFESAEPPFCQLWRMRSHRRLLENLMELCLAQGLIEPSANEGKPIQFEKSDVMSTLRLARFSMDQAIMPVYSSGQLRKLCGKTGFDNCLGYPIPRNAAARSIRDGKSLIFWIDVPKNPAIFTLELKQDARFVMKIWCLREAKGVKNRPVAGEALSILCRWCAKNSILIPEGIL